MLLDLLRGDALLLTLLLRDLHDNTNMWEWAHAAAASAALEKIMVMTCRAQQLTRDVHNHYTGWMEVQLLAAPVPMVCMLDIINSVDRRTDRDHCGRPQLHGRQAPRRNTTAN